MTGRVEVIEEVETELARLMQESDEFLCQRLGVPAFVRARFAEQKTTFKVRVLHKVVNFKSCTPALAGLRRLAAWRLRYDNQLRSQLGALARGRGLERDNMTQALVADVKREISEGIAERSFMRRRDCRAPREARAAGAARATEQRAERRCVAAEDQKRPKEDTCARNSPPKKALGRSISEGCTRLLS